MDGQDVQDSVVFIATFN